METLRERQSSRIVTASAHSGSARSIEIAQEGDLSIDNISRKVADEGDTSGLSSCAVVSDIIPDSASVYHECKHVNYRLLKRAFDLIVATVMILLSWPIMILAALLVRLTSRGPAIFKQVRVGLGGRRFMCYKFRSMCEEAEDLKPELAHLNELEGPVFKIKRDPRITPVGFFIRKFSIDELPQLFNVLKGDMSIVGPRPPLPSETEMYTSRERRRLAVQPGLTCLWQISGRSDIPFDRWIDLDLQYIDQMSFLTDIHIVAKTIPAVITGAGAH